MLLRPSWIALAACAGAVASGCDSTEVASGDADSAVPGDAAFPDGGNAAADSSGEGAVIGCGSDSAARLRACVERSRLEQDVAAIAQERVPGSAHWQVVQDLCADRLEGYGFAVERHDYGTGVNVVGTLAGGGPVAESVVLSAHYDHIPGCNGADDDASGVAAILEAARVLSTAALARKLVVACWDEEERGLVGSGAYAARARAAGEDIAVAYSLDPVGFTNREPGSQTMPAGFEVAFPALYKRLADREFRADWIGIVADVSADAPARSLEAHANAIGLVNGVLELTPEQIASPLFSDLSRSDHASFWQAGYPAIELGDTGEFRNPGYHCRGGADDPSTLDYEFLTRVTAATVGSAAETAGVG